MLKASLLLEDDSEILWFLKWVDKKWGPFFLDALVPTLQGGF